MGQGWHLGCGRSFVSTDKRGEDTVFPAEQLLWLVELKDGSALQDNHQVCTQDGVHAVLGGAGGLSVWCRQGWATEASLLHLGGGGMWPECPLSVVTALSRGGTPNPPSANATFSLTRSQICSEIPSTHMSQLLWRSNPSLARRALGHGWTLEPGKRGKV